MKLSELPTGPPKILLYGAPGTGKSLFEATAGECTQILDIDSGMLSARTFKDDFSEARMACDVISIVDTPQSGKFNQLRSELSRIQAAVVAKNYPYKVLCLDSLTTLSESSVRSVAMQSGRLALDPSSKALEIQHWGLAFGMIENILYFLRALPLVVVVIAHQRKDPDDKSIDLSMPGQKLPEKIPSWFDEVWYARIKPGQGLNVQHVIQTRADSSVMARSRANLPAEFPMSQGLPKTLELMGYRL